MDNTPLHEKKIHGTATAPYSVYHGNIPEWIISFPLHWHEEFELIYCMQGKIRVTVWGIAYILCAKDLLVVLPHAVHSIEQCGAKSGDYYNIMFHPSVFRLADEDPCYQSFVLPFLRGERTMDSFYGEDSEFNRAVTPCIRSILEHRKQIYSTHALLMRSNLFLLLHCMNQYSVAAAEESGSLQLSYSRLKNALYYVQHFYDHEISVRSAARQCGFSESHFMKLFKELTGMSFNAYLVNYRLELAAKQLAETKYKVIDIAVSCGFHNPSYFTRVFQRKYGMAPLAYRRKAKGFHMNEYRFYGWEQASVHAITDHYSGIKTPIDLYDALSEIWCAMTCAPRMRAEWTPENKTLGQCSITAFLAQDIFGGKVYGILRPGGNYHCYNVIGDCCFDLTSEQFGDEVLVYENNPEQFREVHFAREEKRLRYEYLKRELEQRNDK